MTKLKRVGLSFVSALGSELLVGASLAAGRGGGLNDMLWAAVGLSIFVIPGWLLSLLLVLLFDRADGWRFWILGIYGTLLGPAIIFAWAVACKAEGSAIEDFAYMGGIALVIAFLSTAVYLSVLKRSPRGSIEETR
jgi:hypothetical protein